MMDMTLGYGIVISGDVLLRKLFLFRLGVVVIDTTKEWLVQLLQTYPSYEDDDGEDESLESLRFFILQDLMTVKRDGEIVLESVDVENDMFFIGLRLPCPPPPQAVSLSKWLRTPRCKMIKDAVTPLISEMLGESYARDAGVQIIVTT